MKNSHTNNTESNITDQDLKILGNKQENLRRDGGADEILKNRNKPVDFTGSDLDVPGRKLPNDRNLGISKDEENQLYSQGGDGNGHLESGTKY